MNKIFAFILVLTFPLLLNAQEAMVMRFPAQKANQVIFTFAGDLFSVALEGGLARQLSSHDGYEMFARFSPDGNWIAFTGQYDGNTEVFVIPSTGGEPKRLSYTATLNRDDVADRMGPNNIVMTWTPDSKNVIFRSRMNSFNAFKGSLFSVPLSGGPAVQLPLAFGSWCSFSPDGKKLAFNKVFREFRTWKYYKGGMADDIWVYDMESGAVERILENVSQDIMPMWHGDKIYFISDRDRTMNLFSIDVNTKEIKKQTQFTDYDIKFPSLGDKGIVFEQAGKLHLFAFETQSLRRIPVQAPVDHAQGRNAQVNAANFITAIDLSPDGNRAIVSGRGDLWSVPAKAGVTRNLTATSGVHDRNPIWSPDGKSIAYISDESGEDEIYVRQQDGSGKAEKITSNSDTYKFQLSWSPDSKMILWGDKMMRLQYVEVASKKVVPVAKSDSWEYGNYEWSPDSKWIAYTESGRMVHSRIKIFSLAQSKTWDATDGWYNSSGVTFSGDGKLLYFVSARDFNPTYSNTEWNHAYSDMDKIYAIPLDKKLASPFKPENNEVWDTLKPSKDFTLDPENLNARIVSFPLDPGNYSSIQSLGDKVYYVKQLRGWKSAKICFYDFVKKKEIEVGEADGLSIAAGGKKALIRKGKDYYILDAPFEKLELEGKKLNLDAMKMTVDLRQEWAQIFNESWRQMRDFFYAPTMHGVDWPSIKRKYEVFIPHLRHRNDLNFIIGEMIGELNVGHAYVGDGDRPSPERILMGLTGAELQMQDGAAKIVRIFEGENWTSNHRSPFSEPGVNVNVGEFIVAVNGKEVKSVSDINQLFAGTAGMQTELLINAKASLEGARKVVITPLSDHSGLYYFNWVRGNIEKVNKATDGQVGYIHVPDMGVPGLNEFVKYFYPQLTKKALIIDVRGNGGGNVSPMLIERLSRQMHMISVARNGTPYYNPFQMVNGPKIVMLDQYSASDGDLFPYRFRKAGLGKLVGQRSWGGVVGIRGSLPFIDGGYLMKPEFAPYDTEGEKWIIEGEGVSPDIEVINDPHQEFLGYDQQLTRTIEEILKELKEKGKELPRPPAFPDKSK